MHWERDFFSWTADRKQKINMSKSHPISLCCPITVDQAWHPDELPHFLCSMSWIIYIEKRKQVNKMVKRCCRFFKFCWQARHVKSGSGCVIECWTVVRIRYREYNNIFCLVVGLHQLLSTQCVFIRAFSAKNTRQRLQMWVQLNKLFTHPEDREQH